MALSKITINHGAIRAHFQAAPFRGTGVAGASGRGGVAGARGGVGRGEAQALANRMALQARINAAERFDQRTTALVSSVVPLVRTGREGFVEVGVQTTVEHGKWLEMGTDFHMIPPGRVVDRRGRPYLQHNPNSPRRPLRDEWILEKRSYSALPHPGNEARNWMSDAVRSVIPGARVRVRALR